MSYNLDSALVLTLRDTIRWESAVISQNGTLPSANLADQFNPTVYQERDRILAYRDLLVAGAVVETSIQVSDVFNAEVTKPRLDGPVLQDYAFDGATMPAGKTNFSQVRHVLNSSVPYDAIRYADADLYGRDCLVYETLARACAQVFGTSSPVPQIDASNTYFSPNGTYAWSLAEGRANRADINNALLLNRELFKNPDQNLADRDNQLAAYTANLVRVLKNPFEFATRLYVEVTGAEARELEVYTLSSETEIERTWTCEPALLNRNKIVYSIADKTLQWSRDRFTDVHPPQLVALSISGILPNQRLTVSAQVPDEKDCRYWRLKAGQIELIGNKQSETRAIARSTDNGEATGGYRVEGGQTLTVPDTVEISTSGTLAAGNITATVLGVPSLSLDVNGGANVSGTSSELASGGATFQHNLLAGQDVILPGVEYLVVNGDGVVYDGVTYTARQTFTGVAGVTSFTYSGVVVSAVHQYKMLFKLALPTGPWRAKLTYTDAMSNQGGFSLKAQYEPSGLAPTVALSDAFALEPPPSSAELYDSDWGYFDTYSTSRFDFPIYWTAGTGAPHIRKITFEPGADVFTKGNYALSAEFNGTASTADFSAELSLPACIQFDFTTSETVINPRLNLTWNETEATDLTIVDRAPFKIKQVSFHSEAEADATPLADGFNNWKEQCLARALSGVQKNYTQYIAACVSAGTEVTDVRTAGTYWDFAAVAWWNSLVEVTTPRLRDVESVSSVVADRQYEATAAVTYAGTNYVDGDRFYGISGTTTFSPAGALNQVGAFTQAAPEHVGRPALVPKGMVYSSSGTVLGTLSTADALPVLTPCQPWMVDIGVLVSGPEFWSTENI